MAQKGKGKKKAANGYDMPDPLPEGEIITDTSKKQWKLGPSIGTGGFGEIYSAQEVGSSGKVPKYVVKIEPHENGPLFVEMHCYMRIAKPNDVEEFCKKKDLSTIGMPVLLGSGTHSNSGKKYRFIVMPKFGTDIWKLFLENNKQFPPVTVYKLGLQMLDVLEYVHGKGYVHADLKGANILLGTDKSTKNQAYLVDFGLASKYNTNKEFKPDPKCAHNGTIEYLSRDAHQGVQTRRGDLEILGYNLIHWLGCTLPWEKQLSDPKAVQASKETSMKDIPKFLEACFGEKSVPDAIAKYFNFVNSLDFNTAPDYKKLYGILLDGLKSAGGTISSPLSFKNANTPTKCKVTSTTTKPIKRRKKIVDEEETPSTEVTTTPTKQPKKRAANRSPKAKKLSKAAANKRKNEKTKNVENGVEESEKLEEVNVTPRRNSRKQNQKEQSTPTESKANGHDDEQEEKPVVSTPKKTSPVKVKPTKKQRGKKKQIDAPPVENGGAEAEETKKPAKRAVKRSSSNMEDATEKTTASPKKRGRKPAVKKDNVQEENEENEYPGFTAEMVELKKKIESKKKNKPVKKPKKAPAKANTEDPQPSTSGIKGGKSKKK